MRAFAAERGVMLHIDGSTHPQALKGGEFMDGKKTTLTQRLSEVEVHQLLARAAELDARFGASVTTEQLTAAALEAGISAEAIAQASAELAAGKLGSPARGAAISASIATAGRVAVSAVLIWWLLVDASRPVAQELALIFAVYGVYKGLEWLSRRFNQGLRAATGRKPAVPLERAAESTDDHTSLSIRLFAAPDVSCGTA